MYFITEKNEKIQLFKNHRNYIKPDWEVMLEPHIIEDYNLKINKGIKELRQKFAASLKENIDKDGFDLSGKHILEVGCHSGGLTYALAEAFNAYVEGIDIPHYGIVQAVNLEVTQENLEKQAKLLEDIREKIGEQFPREVRERVTFRHLDVAEMEEKENYDAVISIDVLEHLSDPKKAFQKIYSSLKPGGISFHRYNSFFSLSGGHSFCTLDFPFGHCSLSPSDFKSYVTTYRPKEAEAAIAFYEQSLNRMTLADLRDYLLDIGFDIFFIAGKPKKDIDPRKLKEKVIEEYLPRVKQHYPRVEVNDFFTDEAMVFVQKPKEKE